MRRRTTIEIEEDLLVRAKRALGQSTTRGTVEEALRRAAQSAEDANAVQAEGQRRYLEGIGGRIDLDVLASEDMWR